jgi:hypothetical protein
LYSGIGISPPSRYTNTGPETRPLAVASPESVLMEELLLIGDIKFTGDERFQLVKSL